MATSKQSHSITTDEARNVAVDFSLGLSEGETLVGTPLIQNLPALTVTDSQISSGVIVINRKSVPAGQAVSFKVSSAEAGIYDIEIVCDTSEGQTVEGKIKLNVVKTVF